MTDAAATSQHALEYLNSIGTLGLAFIVWALMTGRLVTRREFERGVAREERLDQRLERALHIGDRAMDASDKLAERLPEKR
jgi:hypothetical protein